MSDATLRIESKFKNARLHQAISEASLPVKDYNRIWASGKKIKSFCDMHGLPLQAVYSLLNLRMKPVALYGGRQKKPKPRPLCVRLAAILNADLAWLFPQELYEIEWPHVLIREINPKRFVSLARAGDALGLPSTQDDEITQRECRETLKQSLETLTPREAKVLAMRFGLDGEEKTLRDTSEFFKVTPARIREIEAKALRKMRHPIRSRRLKPFIV